MANAETYGGIVDSHSALEERWPALSLVGAPAVLFLALKPVVDAFYAIEWVRVVYSLCLLVFIVFATIAISGPLPQTSRRGNLLTLAAVLLAYGLLLISKNGVSALSVGEYAKILSPFAIYLLLSRRISTGYSVVLMLSAAVTLIGAAVLMPFEFGWQTWGFTRTFVGWYYFKTDVAFAAVTSLLMIALYRRFVFDLWVALAAVTTVAIVVGANARLNYVTLGLVLSFILIKSRPDFVALAKVVTSAGVASLLAFVAYDHESALGLFEGITELESYTQGRAEIWEILISMGLAHFDLNAWLFGSGFGADVDLTMRFASGPEAYTAHNELLYLVLTQGLVGCVLYICAWGLLVRDATRYQWPPFLSGVVPLAVSVLVVQSLTANVSPFTTKTWPIVFIAFLATSLAFPTRITPESRAITQVNRADSPSQQA